MVNTERVKAISALYGCTAERAQELLEHSALDAKQLRKVDDFIARTQNAMYRQVIESDQEMRAKRARLKEVLSQYDLPIGMWCILGIVYDGGKDGVTITRIARELDTSLAYATTSVHFLIYRGLVEKRGNVNDQRKRFVTYKAGNLIPQIEKAVANIN